MDCSSSKTNYHFTTVFHVLEDKNPHRFRRSKFPKSQNKAKKTILLQTKYISTREIKSCQIPSKKGKKDHFTTGDIKSLQVRAKVRNTSRTSRSSRTTLTQQSGEATKDIAAGVGRVRGCAYGGRRSRLLGFVHLLGFVQSCSEHECAVRVYMRRTC